MSISDVIKKFSITIEEYHEVIIGRVKDVVSSTEKPVVVALGKNALSLVEHLYQDLEIITMQPGGYYAGNINNPNITVFHTTHPNITKQTVSQSEAVLRKIQQISSDQTLIVIITGGSSASIAIPEEGISVDLYNNLVGKVMKQGWDIKEINQLRSIIDQVKGGKLGEACRGELISLIVSDVISDDPSIVGSGPTVSGIVPSSDVIEFLSENKISKEILGELLRKLNDVSTAKQGKLIGRRRELIEMFQERLSVEYNTTICDISLEHSYLKCAEIITDKIKSAERNSIMIFAGEPSINTLGFKPGAEGGRISAMMVEMAGLIRNMERNVSIIGIATDGRDGNSPGALYRIDNSTRSKLDKYGKEISEGHTGRVLKDIGNTMTIEFKSLNLLDIYLVLTK